MNNKLIEILDDKKLITLVLNMQSGQIDVPYIISETLNTLGDESPFFNLIKDSDKIAMCKMIDMYFNDCYQLFITECITDKLLAYGKQEIYKIDAPNGLRYATSKEVSLGIRGLIPEDIYPAGEDEYKYLCLLYWTFTGKAYYFRQAGLKLSYTSDGKVIESFYEMIKICAYKLKDMIDWVADQKRLDKTIKIIEKFKKNNGFRYASYEKDEITDEMTIKQLIYNISKTFPKNSSNINYRKAIALVIKYNRCSKYVTPYEISQLRQIYNDYALDKNRANKSEQSDAQLKEECEIIQSNKFTDKIKPDDFVFKIIETLRNQNYSKCSSKQYAYIKHALDIIKSNNQINKETTVSSNIISDDDIDSSLETISNAIGNGLFDDVDE